MVINESFHDSKNEHLDTTREWISDLSEILSDIKLQTITHVSISPSQDFIANPHTIFSHLRLVVSVRLLLTVRLLHMAFSRELIVDNQHPSECAHLIGQRSTHA